MSDSVIAPAEHGVHSAYLEDLSALRRADRVALHTRVWASADIHHVHTVGPLGVTALLKARGRSVIVAHLTPTSLVGSLTGSRHWLRIATRYLVAAYNRAGVVLALNPQDAHELVILGVRRPIHIMPNSIDHRAILDRLPTRQAARSRLGYTVNEPVVVTVGQLQPRKGVETFLRAAEENPDVRFVWVGAPIFGWFSDAWRGMKRLMSAPPANVAFVGAVRRTAVLDHLASGDLFFLPSWHESCSIAVLEAAAASLPIMLRDLPQHRALYGDACLYGDDSTFADLIRSCFRRPELASIHRARSRSLARRFDSMGRADLLIQLYQQLLTAASRHSGLKEPAG